MLILRLWEALESILFCLGPGTFPQLLILVCPGLQKNSILLKPVKREELESHADSPQLTLIHSATVQCYGASRPPAKLPTPGEPYLGSHPFLLNDLRIFGCQQKMGLPKIPVINQSNHMMLYFTIILLSDNNPDPNCCHNPRTTYLISICDPNSVQRSCWLTICSVLKIAIQH